MVTTTENILLGSERSRSVFVTPPVQSSIDVTQYAVEIRTFPNAVEIRTFPEKTPIPASNYVLQFPIVTEVQVTKDGIIIKYAYIDEEAYGDTLQAACVDFLTSIRDRYHSLRRREKRLSPHDQTILERLRTLLEPS